MQGQAKTVMVFLIVANKNLSSNEKGDDNDDADEDDNDDDILSCRHQRVQSKQQSM